MATKKKMLQAAAGNAGGGGPLNVEDVFSTYVYEGDGTYRDIINGIDLSNEGGMVWVKNRNGTHDHIIADTERGVNKGLSSSSAGTADTATSRINGFLEDGFSVGNSYKTNNGSGNDYASWTFRKAPKFFTCLTYSGTGPGSGANEQQVSHDLGAKPGIVIIKRTDATGDWWVFTDVIDGSNDYGYLNQTVAFGNSANNVATDTVFNVGGSLNTSGATYVAYLFASNDGDGEFGPDGDADIIKCGSYTGNGSTDGPEIDLGFEPQWVMIKSSSNADNWNMYDNMRGVTGSSSDPRLVADQSNAEITGFEGPQFNATGFKMVGTAISNGSGRDYIYIAIRRGTKVPESATEVFAIDTLGSTTPNPPSYNAGFPVDLGIMKSKTSGTDPWRVGARLTGEKQLRTNATDAEITDTQHKFDYQDGWYDAGAYVDSQYQSWMWKRAPGYFDAVAYTGNGTAGRTVSHNLGVAPEMMWVKCRSTTEDWATYHTGVGAGVKLLLNQDWNSSSDTTIWNNTTPSETDLTLGTSLLSNGSGRTYIAYLFASLPGISKVGSYTGNSTGNASGITQTIDCGFTSGARFVLIKKTNGTGSWVVFDTERGIVSGNDPYLKLNETTAESTVTDAIDPHSSGFTLTSSTLFNSNGDSYIFYAIA